MKLKTTLIVLLLLSTGLLTFADSKGEEIARKHYALKEADDMSCNTKMILIDKNGNKQTRFLKVFSKEGKNGKNSFSEFMEPADVKGTKFLTIVEQNGDNVQRLYLPALKKIRRISSSNKDGKFMGSDMSYYDMEDRDFEDYNYEFIAENQTIKGKSYEGMKFYVIKTTPKDPEAPYAYSKIWVNMDNYSIYKITPYDKKGKLEKIIMIMSIEKHQGVSIPVKTLVINQKEKHKTMLVVDSIKVNSGLKSNIFEVQNLK